MLQGAQAVEARKEFRRFIAKKSKDLAVFRGRVLAKYTEELKNGASDVEAAQACLQKFEQDGLTQRRLDNFLTLKGKFGNPKLNTAIDANIAMYFGAVQSDIEEIRSHCDDVLDKIDEMEESGEDKYTREVIEAIGGKIGDTVTTKALPLDEARYIVMSRKADALNRFFDGLKAVRAGNTFNFGDNAVIGQFTFADLQDRIRELEKEHKIKDGVAVESQPAQEV